jgi:hypothetical protein
MAHSVRITLDPFDLATPHLCDWSEDGGEGLVRIGSARAWVTAEQALEIAEAWRGVELALIEKRHGAEA